MRDITFQFEHDICFWDNTHIFASRPIRRAAVGMAEVEAVDPDAFYRLGDCLKVRSETFGCLVQNRDLFTIKCFDEEAYMFFDRLREGLFGEQILRTVAPQNLTFVEDRIRDRTISQFGSEPTYPCRAEFFDHRTPEVPMSAPVALEIEITLKCNRKCLYCAYDSSPYVDTKGELSADEWKRILSEGRDAGAVSIEFTGGDPLTRADGLDILEFADSLGFLFTINSDLTLIPGSAMERVAAMENLVAVQTTLDGASNEVHDFYRGKGGFGRTIRNIKGLVAGGIPVGVGMIVSKRNYDKVSEVATLCRDLGVSYFFVGGLYVAGRAEGLEADVPSNEELGVASRAFAQAVFSGTVEPAHPSFYRHRDAFEQNADTFNHLTDQPYMATVGVDTLRFNPEGRCYTCIKLKGRDDFYVGDARKESVLEIWQKSDSINRLRREYEEHGAENFHGVDLRLLH